MATGQMSQAELLVEVQRLRERVDNLETLEREHEVATAELYERVEQLTTLQRVDDELMGDLDLEYVISMALDECMRFTQADAGFIALLEADGGVRVSQVVGAYPVPAGVVYLDENVGIIGRVLRQKKAELTRDVSKDPDYNASIAGMRSQITIPLLTYDDRLIGVLCLETRSPGYFNRKRFDFLRLVTTRIALAVDNAELYAALKQHYDELQRLYAHVKQLEQMKSEMIQIAAHDLRNPAGRVSGSIALLRMDLWDQLTEDQQSLIEISERALSRMQTITDDVLSLQRIEQAAENAPAQEIRLNELLAKAFEADRTWADQKAQEYILRLPAAPLIVSGDPTQLYEAISNLIGNAIKYTPALGCVTARLSQQDDAVLLEVEDTGCGIPAEHQDKLFAPFYRAKTVETQDIDGTGLGLHLVKSIITRHDGEMRFRSTYGEGSTFGFTLPLVKDRSQL